MNAPSLYRFVVEDVIRNVKAEFESEGLDDSTLHDLQQLWESKLSLAGVYEPEYHPAHNYTGYELTTNYLPAEPQQNNLMSLTQNAMFLNPNMFMNHSNLTSVNNNSAVRAPARQSEALNLLRSMNTQQQQQQQQQQQITTPNYTYDAGKPQPYMQPTPSWGTPQTTQQSVNTNNYLLQNRQTDGCNDDDDIVLLEQQQQQQQQQKDEERKNADETIFQMYKEKLKYNEEHNIPQFDGNTKKEEDDDDDDDTVAAKADDDDLDDLGSSDDDDDDKEPETEHIVLCQYEKVTRVKNKRKANLKDGIMHINGRDFVFSKSAGEFDW